jgi:uncharacterized protein
MVLLASLAMAGAGWARGADDCHVGSYRLVNGDAVDVAPSEGDTLRWRRFDGTTGALHRTTGDQWASRTGWTDRPDGKVVTFADCAAGWIVFDGIAGKRIEFASRDVTFRSHDTAIVGRLVLPVGAERVPVVVLLHGSEHDSALDSYSLQRMLPAEGIGVFVYDKRGTGQSKGSYTQDFDLLADDAVVAMREARRLAGNRATRVGYQGGSQGGWVAPIAANRARVDFVIVCFGLAVSVIDEDQQAVEIQMREKGWSDAVILQAKEIAHAAEEVFASDFTTGFAELDAVRDRYRAQPWYKDVRGDFAWAILPYSESEIRAAAAQFHWNTPFRYDPMPTLAATRTPQLWILGGEDYEAPSAVTSERIRSLIARGKPFTLANYPTAEHGMTLFEMKDGERISTRFAPGYFEMMRDFIRDGRIGARYGDAVLSPGAKRTSRGPT